MALPEIIDPHVFREMRHWVELHGVRWDSIPRKEYLRIYQEAESLTNIIPINKSLVNPKATHITASLGALIAPLLPPQLSSPKAKWKSRA